MKRTWVFVLATVLCGAIAWSSEHPSPYVGEEGRVIKALSDEEVRGYLSGDGMGFAKVAELNHYPGPRHVLDLADRLQVSDDQRRTTQAIFEKMKAETMNLGKELVEKERLLDSRFAGGTISDPELKQLVSEIAAIQGKLRTAHLQANLALRDLLTRDQIRHYDALRGYRGSATAGQHGGH
ncbi:MAG: hypothetical protein A2038_05080 [Deltaproteobacteria bacterium GWA2_57_13]|nr:MAG: hypothetical protein A2038_05080 [Deltaproteobacteria bacterium GWA2_57_13]